MEEQKTLIAKVNKKALLARYLKILIPLCFAAVAAVVIFMPKSAVAFYAAIIVACVLFCLYFVVSTNGSTEVKCLPADEYRGPHIYVGMKGRTYEVFDISKGDITIRQTNRQKALDQGDMVLRDEHIHVTDLENISSVLAFLHAHFPGAVKE